MHNTEIIVTLAALISLSVWTLCIIADRADRKESEYWEIKDITDK